jgi:hypothetical protein
MIAASKCHACYSRQIICRILCVATIGITNLAKVEPISKELANTEVEPAKARDQATQERSRLNYQGVIVQSVAWNHVTVGGALNWRFLRRSIGLQG